MSKFEALVDYVIAIDSSKSRSDVLLDLEYTKSAEETINRIFDGKFLQGIQCRFEDTMVILDSDEEEEERRSELDLPELPNGTQNNFDFTDETPSQKLDTLDFLDDDYDITKNQYIFDDEDEVMSLELDKNDYQIARSPKRRISLDSLEEISPIRYTHRIDEFKSRESTPRRDLEDSDDQFSYPSKSIAGDDDDLMDSLSLEPKNRKRKASPTSNSICLMDSDSDNSLPSVNDFFDQLMSQKELPDRKGKQRAFEYSSPTQSEPISESSSVNNEEYSSSFNLTTRERKRLEAEERKRTQAEERRRAAEEKKLKRAELLEEKKRAKEKKALERERTAIFEKENRIKNNRVETIKEMIVDIHPDFIKTKAGELLKLVLEKKETVIHEAEPTLYHISWRRICKSVWDNDTMAFIPFKEPKIMKEPYVLVYIDMKEFFRHIQADTTDFYVDTIKRSAGAGQQIIFLIEGLQGYYRKKVNLERRIFDEQVRSTIEGASTSKRKSQPEIENGPSQKQVEESINFLIMRKGIMFVLTKSNEDTSSWIESLTTDLALGRYKEKNVNFSYKSRVACSDPSDNFSKILQEIQLCTPAVATSVMNEYPTLQSLHKTYERKSTTDGEQILADLDVERSAFIARDRKINRVMSKKIYKIFCTSDPNQVIS